MGAPTGNIFYLNPQNKTNQQPVYVTSIIDEARQLKADIRKLEKQLKDDALIQPELKLLAQGKITFDIHSKDPGKTLASPKLRKLNSKYQEYINVYTCSIRYPFGKLYGEEELRQIETSVRNTNSEYFPIYQKMFDDVVNKTNQDVEEVKQQLKVSLGSENKTTAEKKQVIEQKYLDRVREYKEFRDESSDPLVAFCTFGSSLLCYGISWMVQALDKMITTLRVNQAQYQSKKAQTQLHSIDQHQRVIEAKKPILEKKKELDDEIAAYDTTYPKTKEKAELKCRQRFFQLAQALQPLKAIFSEKKEQEEQRVEHPARIASMQ